MFACHKDAIKALAMASMGTAVDASAALQLTDFVADEQPSAYLKLTMSRRIKEKAIVEAKLVPFLQSLLEPVGGSDAGVKRVLYGSGSRRVVLLELQDVAVAVKLRELLHEKPCELIGRRPLYAEFALPRKEQEARDRLLRVHNVLRNADPPGLRVPGLRFEAEFITKEQEAACVAFFDRDNGAVWANTIRARQVQHFGYEFNYDTRRCDPDQPMKDPIPAVLQPIVDQIAACGIMDGDTPDQITVNEYLPGQGIAYHLDTHSAFTTTIASLSICSEVVMDFRHPDGVRHEGVLLPARSLAVMSGESRYKWEHAICPRTFDVIDGKQVNRQRRLSITFRKIRSGPCECPFPAYCDTVGREGQEEDVSADGQVKGRDGEASLAPTPLEQQYVHEFYETVAAHFSSTRHSPWPRVAQFVTSLPSGSMIADLGCGNGKYMKCVDETQSFVVGGDRSSRLVGICRDRGLEAMVCDALAVPLRSNSCDAALSIAVLHHLSTLGHRLAAVKELLRVLRVGGRGIIYAWAHEQMKGSRRRFEEGRQDFMVPWNLDKRFAFSAEGESTEGNEPKEKEEASENVTSGDSADDQTASKPQERVVVQRYCHMFKQGELEELVALAGNAEVEESYYDESNWAVVIHRTS